MSNKIENRQPITMKAYNKTNWPRFYLQAMSKLSNIRIPNDYNLSTTEIDMHIEKITEAIREIETNNVPTIKISNRDMISLTPITIKLIKYKNHLCSFLFRFLLGANANIFKSQIKCLNTIIKEQVEFAKSL